MVTSSIKRSIRMYANRIHGGPIIGGYVHVNRRLMIAHAYLVLFCVGIQFDFTRGAAQ